MNAALYAVSLASEPVVAVNTWFNPFGAARKIPLLSVAAQLDGGKLPRAGRFMIALIMARDEAISDRRGLLYPKGIDDICANLNHHNYSINTFTYIA